MDIPKRAEHAPIDGAEALVPAIRLAIWHWEQRTEIEEEAREEELSRLSTEVPYQHRLL